MNRTLFEEPVTIFTGMGLPTKIESAMDAYALLQDGPVSSRNAAHAVALKACRAALTGDVDAETARATFVQFARRSDILAPDAAADLPAYHWAARTSGGKAPTGSRAM